MHKRAVLTLLILLIGATMTFAAGKFTLVIDAGHGGHDTGAKGAYSQEKDINLKVALAFGKYVEQNCKDVNVIYTRKTDVFIPLKQRANIANRNNADLFVSVHTNALPAGRIVRGFEVYTLGMHRAKDNLDVAMRENSVIEEEDNYKQVYQGFDPKSSESYIMFEFMQSANMRRSVELAKMIENSACATADRVNMGVHQAGFLVLRETSMPSCLIELGFITTPDEEDFLNTDDGQDKLALGIYKAFVQYKDKYSGAANRTASTTTAPVTTMATDATANTLATKPDTVKKVDKPAKPTKPSKPAKPATNSKPNTTAKPTTAAKPNKPATTDKPTKPVTASKPAKTESVDQSQPVFKVQIFAVARKINAGDPLFKGHKDVDTYKEAGSSLIKYTIGNSNNYDDIVGVRNSLKADFPEAYIVAFKNGKSVELSQAVNEYKKNKRKQSHKK